MFCWRSFEHEVPEISECPPEEIVQGINALQKKALSGYKVSPSVTAERFSEALNPRHVAISLSGEPTLYSSLPTLIRLLSVEGYMTFLVSNGTRPDILTECEPFQLYVSLDAPDRETYMRVCRPTSDTWDEVCESLGLLSKRRSAIRVTLVRGVNDRDTEGYGRLIQDSGARFVEVKGYMYLGYSRKRLTRDHMPGHDRVQAFAEAIESCTDYTIRDESPLSRVVCLERRS
jgi:tRNA wybutosine-synthesizing protein 1